MKKTIFKLLCCFFGLIPTVCFAKITCSSAGFSAVIDISKTNLSMSEKSFITVSSDATYSVLYSSSNNKIITIDNNGIITPVSEGSGDILVMINFLENNEIKSTCSSKYTISVLASDSSLKTLYIDSQNILEKDKLEYEINLPYQNESIDILAEPNSNKAKVVGNGKRYLNEGINEFSVIVTSENGINTTYKVVVNREYANDDNTLKSLVVEGFILEPKFANNIYEYNLNIDKNIDEIKISAQTTYEYAKVSGTGKFGVPTGKTSFYVTVTAENQTTQTYTINVFKNNGSSKLSDLIIEDYNIDFKSDVYVYNLTVKNKVDTLNIIPKVIDSETTQIEIIGDELLKVGKNDIIIRVTDKDASSTTYKIVVNRLSEEEQKEITKNNTLLIILFSIFILSIIIMVVCIGAFLRRFYKQKKYHKITKDNLLKRIRK